MKILVIPHPKTTPGKVWINKTQYFAGISPEVWDFYIGGLPQVCQKWLKDRKGREVKLSLISPTAIKILLLPFGRNYSFDGRNRRSY